MSKVRTLVPAVNDSGAALGTPTPAAKTPPPSDRRRHNAAARTSANRQLGELTRALGAVTAIADDWLSAGHGPECQCRFCAFHGSEVLEIVAADVSGALWAASSVSGHVEASILTPRPRKAVKS